jgi:sarcosine oxidase delta subunit
MTNTIACPYTECDKRISYERSDVYSTPSGMLAMKCPHCTRRVMLKMTNEGDVRAEKLS